MNRINIIEHVTLGHDTRVITIRVLPTGADVFLDNLYTPGYDKARVILNWDHLVDIEHLYNRFDEEAVRTFKKLCEMMATIHSNKHLYEALL